MNVGWRHLVRLVAVLCAALLPLSTLHPQEVAGESAPPLPKSPVESFRELLTMTPAERRQAVADRPPENQKLILAKVREYLLLKPDERELRLRATELRWYLLPLLSTPATNRAAQFALIPPDLRPLVDDRLTLWDLLPGDAQAELLENELISQYFIQFERSTSEQRTNLLAGVSPRRRAQLEAGLARWRTLSEAERRETCARFERFLELTPREREKALNAFSVSERQQMERTLRAFERLPRDQREVCVRSFEKFARLGVEERQLFLRNAERWRLMSPDERQAWRNLVALMPGQLPPPPLPPLPPGSPPSAATNVN